METLIGLSEIVGKQRIAWRYDPVLLTKEYTIKRHLETFERMAKVLSPYIDRCIFSFALICILSASFFVAKHASVIFRFKASGRFP